MNNNTTLIIILSTKKYLLNYLFDMSDLIIGEYMI